MRQDCAALVEARQSREDSLIQTITQISSAALLAIPGFLLTSDLGAPNFEDGWSLYLGAILFISTLFISMLEQHFSAKSYKIHEQVVQKYYLLEKQNNCDQQSINLVNNFRIMGCILFFFAVLISAFGLTSLMGEYNGRSNPTTSSTSSPAASSPAASSTSSPAAASTSPVAVSFAGIRRSRNTEVSAITNSSAAEEITPR
jgi:hypothetical protein